MVHPATPTTPPNASHDQCGCRRRGAQRKMPPNAAAASARATGQRSTCHARCVAWPPTSPDRLRPTVSIVPARMKAASNKAASRRARAYFWMNGQSFSTPYRRLIPRMSCPVAVVAVTRVPTRPKSSGRKRCSRANSCACAKTLTRRLPAGPGTAFSMALKMVRLKPVCVPTIGRGSTGMALAGTW